MRVGGRLSCRRQRRLEVVLAYSGRETSRMRNAEPSWAQNGIMARNAGDVKCWRRRAGGRVSCRCQCRL